MTQDAAATQYLLSSADAWLWLDVQKELDLLEWEQIEWDAQPQYTAEEMEQIRIAHILATPYESPYAEAGASKRQRRQKRKAYFNGGAARNHLYDLQNGFGGQVPEHYQREKLLGWTTDSIKGMTAGELRGYMALWLRPLLVSGNVAAVKAILSAYQDGLEAEKTAVVQLLEILVPELSVSAEQLVELDEFVDSLAETRKRGELGLRESVTPERHPPVAPIAPPRA